MKNTSSIISRIRQISSDENSTILSKRVHLTIFKKKFQGFLDGAMQLQEKGKEKVK
jgi:hypothetical protein